MPVFRKTRAQKDVNYLQFSVTIQSNSSPRLNGVFFDFFKQFNLTLRMEEQRAQMWEVRKDQVQGCPQAGSAGSPGGAERRGGGGPTVLSPRLPVSSLTQKSCGDGVHDREGVESGW